MELNLKTDVGFVPRQLDRSDGFSIVINLLVVPIFFCPLSPSVPVKLSSLCVLTYFQCRMGSCLLKYRSGCGLK